LLSAFHSVSASRWPRQRGRTPATDRRPKCLFENPAPSEDVPGVVARKAEGLPLGRAQGLRPWAPRGAATGAPQPVLGSQTATNPRPPAVGSKKTLRQA
jgi:hypothetical protein